MKHIKKYLAFLLALGLCLTSCAAALAYDAGPEDAAAPAARLSPRLDTPPQTALVLQYLVGLIGEDDGFSLSELDTDSDGIVTPQDAATLLSSPSGDDPGEDPGGDEPAGDAPAWTFYIYLCGSNLESDGGSASADIDEMISASAVGDVAFMIETGGSSYWYKDYIDPARPERYRIADGGITCVDQLPASSMGSADTLAGFLSWAAASPSEHTGVILWDHGNGSLGGLCWDEVYDDSLSLEEMRSALSGAGAGQFDLIGFDACLMATFETACIVSDYASYMIASQELEPGTGWDYAAIGSYLSQHPKASSMSLSMYICEAYISSVGAGSDDTLSLVDLSRIGALADAFDALAGSMCAISDDGTNLPEMMRAIQSADNFGGNNRAEDYTNMIDMGGLITACLPYADEAAAALAALNGAVVHSIGGANHPNASGLSLFYPLGPVGQEELALFRSLCVSDDYYRFVETYSSSGGEEPIEPGELITFENPPQLDDEGHYWFSFDENGWNNAAYVTGMVYELSNDGTNYISIGETADVWCNWSENFFCDQFDGRWLSLPDGQNLALSVVSLLDEGTLYTSPILLNGELCYLRMLQYYDGSPISIQGVWYGTGDYGASARDYAALQPGDVITPFYFTDSDITYIGHEYTVTDDMYISYALMEPGMYLYTFLIGNYYGGTYETGPAVFTVHEDGAVTFIDPNHEDDTDDEPLDITYAAEPQVGDDDSYWFILDENGLNNTFSVLDEVYEISEDGQYSYRLGESYHVSGSWDTGYFASAFDAVWPSLPDGQRLSLTILDVGENWVLYSAPVDLNGDPFDLLFTLYDDGSCTIEGVNTGSEFRPVVPGDVIMPLYYTIVAADGSETYFQGVPYTVGTDFFITTGLMEPAMYTYSFLIWDARNYIHSTDTMVYRVTEDGGCYLYRDEEPAETITFAAEPQLDEEGVYWFMFDDNGLKNTYDVTADIYECSEDEGYDIFLGNTNNVVKDWDNGVIRDDFSSYWPSLPDGQNLCLYMLGYDDYGGVQYMSPIEYNGSLASLFLTINSDWSISVIGISLFESENIFTPEEGAEIVPLYDAYSRADGSYAGYEGWTYTVPGELTLSYELLAPDVYSYSFVITDIYNEDHYTAPVYYNVDETGTIFF